jgi:hypothetical protein
VVERASRGEALRAAHSLGFLGEAEYRRGALDEAADLTEQAVGEAEENGRVWDFALLRRLSTTQADHPALGRRATGNTAAVLASTGESAVPSPLNAAPAIPNLHRRGLSHPRSTGRHAADREQAPDHRSPARSRTATDTGPTAHPPDVNQEYHMRLHLDRAARIRTAALLTAAAATLAVVPATTAQALAHPEGGPMLYCSTYTSNGQGSVDCTDSLDGYQLFQSWSETGATSVYEDLPYELGFYCTIGSQVSATLHTSVNSPAWYGTCA